MVYIVNSLWTSIGFSGRTRHWTCVDCDYISKSNSIWIRIKLVTETVCIYFKKALDLVDHNHLLNTLLLHEISDLALSWLKSYITDISQFICNNWRTTVGVSVLKLLKCWHSDRWLQKYYSNCSLYVSYSVYFFS